MGSHVKLGDRFTVGTGQPTEGTLTDLARRGFKAVVSLRTLGEPNQPPDPNEEGEKVRARGMEHRHVPVAGDALEPERVDEFRDAVKPLPGPIFVHCASGIRAGAFTVMRIAAEEGRTGDQALAAARERHLPIEAPALASFVTSYVDTR